MKKCEQNVSEHEDFEEKYEAANKWVTEAQTRFSACDTPLQTSDELTARQATVQVTEDIIHAELCDYIDVEVFGHFHEDIM